MEQGEKKLYWDVKVIKIENKLIVTLKHIQCGMCARQWSERRQQDMKMRIERCECKEK